MNNIFSRCFAIVTLLMLGMTSCVDEIEYETPGSGEGNLSMVVDFEPLVSALDSRSPGNELGALNSLTVLVYSVDHTLVKRYHMGDLKNWSYTNTEMPTNNGKPIGNQAEPNTAHAEFTLPDKLPFGRYRIYCAANVDISEEEAKDINKVKNKLLDWNPDNISANNQMFGYFTTGKNNAGGALDFDAGVITLKEQTKTIHAWLRRAASKVTVAFDGTGLHQNVWIYVKSVTLYDIPKQCRLGAENKPDAAGQLYNHKSKDMKPVANSVMYYNKTEFSTSDASGTANDPGPDYNNWMKVAKGLGNKEGVIGSTHSPQANALYFFENNQGNYTGDEKYNKHQDKAKVGHNIKEGEDDYKDNIPYGTYIEVEAYYISTNMANTSNGDIKYRFMLGKDIDYDYNAARNHHFKVTLGFKGWANQPDWHIEYYEPDPDLDIPDVFRVSYLYNQKAIMPIKLTGNCTSLKVEIEENGWIPTDSLGNPAPAELGSGHGAWRWNTVAGDKYTGKAYPYLGFLALRVPGAEMKDVPTDIVQEYSFSDRDDALDALNAYYKREGQNERDFSTETMKADGGADGKGGYEKGSNNAYQVHQLDKDTKMILMPVFTRNHSMIRTSGYSGNNPYDSYYRKAVIKVTARFNVSGKEYEIVKRTRVMQVPKLANPKGVWRSKENNKDFEVHLVTMHSGDAATFYGFESNGDWKAYVEVPKGGSDVVKLYTNQPETKTYMKGDTIIGNTSTIITFGLRFSGTVGDNDSKCAIVRVDYHGCQCVHRIMVRRGYLDPIAIVGDTEWSSFSLVGAKWISGDNDGYDDSYEAELTVNPLMEGSFFRRGMQSKAILSKNDTKYPFKIYEAPGGSKFQLWSSTGQEVTANWTGIGRRNDKNTTRGMGTYVSKDKIGGKKRKYRVPTFDDFHDLQTHADYGFGVFYGDGATTTQMTTAMAYGLTDPDNNTKESPMGMRGVVVYNQTNANQIFFPLGSTGMGRRRQFNVSGTNYRGTLWYGDVNDVLTTSLTLPTNPSNTQKNQYNNQFRPIAYNLPASPGAIYWIDKWVSGDLSGTGDPCMGWDLNYFNFDFGPYTDNNYQDGCLIKLIYTGDE